MNIQEVKSRVDLRDVARHLQIGLPDREGVKFRSPFREDRNPSCELRRGRSGELLFVDRATGQYLDVLAFTAAALCAPDIQALRKLVEIAGAGAPLPRSTAFQKLQSAPHARVTVSPSLLSRAEVWRFGNAALSLAEDERLLPRLAESRDWRPETVRAIALEGHLGWEPGSRPRLLFLYSHGAKARWKDAAGKRVVRWIAGGPAGCLWRAGCLHRGIRRVVVTEGETDTISLVSVGAEDDGETLVVALPSASATFDPEPFRGRDVVLAPDADDAGATCLERLRRIFHGVAKTRECSVALLLRNNGKEPSE